jgi:hypothetical protein
MAANMFSAGEEALRALKIFGKANKRIGDKPREHVFSLHETPE